MRILFWVAAAIRCVCLLSSVGGSFVLPLCAPKADPKPCGARPARRSARSGGGAAGGSDHYSTISVAAPQPTHPPPPRSAKRRPRALGVGWGRSGSLSAVCPGGDH